MTPIKIIIADDQLFIDGIRSILADDSGVEIVGEALNGRQVLQVLNNQKVGVILMDINMPVMDGVAATKEVLARFPDIKVLMLTMYNAENYISTMLEAGASGYLKDANQEELLTAIRTVHRGEQYFSQAVSMTIMKSYQQKVRGAGNDSPVKLTKREMEVLKLISKELSTNEIAEQLFISQSTVITHRKNMIKKLGLRNTAGLVRYAIENGLVG